MIRARRPEDDDAVVALSPRAWAPVFASIEDVLGSELSTLLHGRDWREHRAGAVREVLGRGAARSFVSPGGRG